MEAFLVSLAVVTLGEIGDKTQLLALVLAAWLYRRLTPDPLRFSPEISREILLSGSAFFVYTAIGNIQPYIDVVILSKLAPADAVGWYGAAKNILGTVLAPAMIIGAASYPRLTRTASNGGPLKTEVRAALRPILWLGALAAIGTFLFADDVIAVVYGQRDFGPAAMILKVYAPGFFLLFIDVLLGYCLFALNRVSAFTVVKAASVVVSRLPDWSYFSSS